MPVTIFVQGFEQFSTPHFWGFIFLMKSQHFPLKMVMKTTEIKRRFVF